jgi:uncharacterized protein
MSGRVGAEVWMRQVVLGVLVGLWLAGSAAAQTEREIVVTGEGRIEVTPDMATVGGGVETQAETAEAALAANAERMQRVIEAVTATGVARQDLQTNQIGLFPVYREQEGGSPVPEVIGYIARNMLQVRVREIPTLGAVLDAMAAAGANRMDGITFGIAEPRVHLDAARRAAVADARAKAALLAEAAGVGLGPVVAIRETQPFNQPFPMRAQADMAMESAVAEGTLTVEAMVEIVLGLAEPDGE